MSNVCQEGVSGNNFNPVYVNLERAILSPWFFQDIQNDRPNFTEEELAGITLLGHLQCNHEVDGYQLTRLIDINPEQKMLSNARVDKDGESEMAVVNIETVKSIVYTRQSLSHYEEPSKEKERLTNRDKIDKLLKQNEYYKKQLGK